MQNLDLKQKIIGAVIAIGLLLIAIFSRGLYSKNGTAPKYQEPVSKQEQNIGVKVLSTDPSPLDETIIVPTQTIKVTFNKAMAIDIAKVSFDPPLKFKLDAQDKTLIITPEKSFNLGTGYTLIIKSGYETKTNEKLDSDVQFHFKTINYNGV